MSIEGADPRAKSSLKAQNVQSVLPTSSPAIASIPPPSSTTKPQILENWNTANTGARVGVDAASAASASISIAPIVTTIDRSIVQKASTGIPFRNALANSVKPMLNAPHHFLLSKPFLLIFTLYFSTYFTANSVDTATSTLHRQPPATVTSGPTKFLTTSAVNMTLCIYKDSCFARMFGGARPSHPAASTIPKITYLLFAARDSLTIFSSFNLPPLISPYLSPAVLKPHFPRFLSTPSSRSNTAQFLAPAAMQLLSTPFHLLGLDMFNRQGKLGFGERFARVRRDWAVGALARMGRIVPAFGIGGVVNAQVRRGLMGKIAGLGD